MSRTLAGVLLLLPALFEPPDALLPAGGGAAHHLRRGAGPTDHIFGKTPFVWHTCYTKVSLNKHIPVHISTTLNILEKVYTCTPKLNWRGEVFFNFFTVLGNI